ncbi:hypothetical protein EV643_116186 [Kribbella sp. VKM Ac-2527]|uniref:Uncharacterized protein n=1 Tax=Kribbella caucasensis TaxID=2512215 RepID=A0A4R6K4Y4_9ACTN|nr:hypothetical protein [Kribbella sp. VKM Ac-2527]TDO44374.1 hypothetical protein EV643_116186 [Kribbella sp. VKM Ac-2527]
MMPKTQAHNALTAVIAAAVLVLPGCTSSGAALDPEIPATVEEISGAKVKRVTLSQKANERLGIKTATLTQQTVAGKPRKVVPASAVLYDANGATWVYTTGQTNSYVRASITIEDITPDFAVLSAGPAVGTTVVSVGAAMLYGTELGVGSKAK